MGTGGCHLLLGWHCAESHVSQDKGGGLAGAEGHGEDGNQQTVLSGGRALTGRAGLGRCHHLCPAPPRWFWAQPSSDGPLPARARLLRCSRRSALLSWRPRSSI